MENESRALEILQLIKDVIEAETANKSANTDKPAEEAVIPIEEYTPPPIEEYTPPPPIEEYTPPPPIEELPAPEILKDPNLDYLISYAHARISGNKEARTNFSETYLMENLISTIERIRLLETEKKRDRPEPS